MPNLTQKELLHVLTVLPFYNGACSNPGQEKVLSLKYVLLYHHTTF